MPCACRKARWLRPTLSLEEAPSLASAKKRGFQLEQISEAGKQCLQALGSHRKRRDDPKESQERSLSELAGFLGLRGAAGTKPSAWRTPLCSKQANGSHHDSTSGPRPQAKRWSPPRKRHGLCLNPKGSRFGRQWVGGSGSWRSVCLREGARPFLLKRARAISRHTQAKGTP